MADSQQLDNRQRLATGCTTQQPTRPLRARYDCALAMLPTAALVVLFAVATCCSSLAIAADTPTATLATSSDPKAEATPKAAEKQANTTLPWLSNLRDGYRKAMVDRKPLLVKFGAKWCAPCRKLAADLETPKLQAELGQWTLVAIDVDAQSEDATQLGITSVPALRVIAADGQVIAATDAYAGPDALIVWLKEHYATATAATDDVLLDSGTPTPNAVMRLVKQLQQRSPMIREAAIRRLSAHPEVARPAVVKAFSEGSLSVRLATFEVMQQWKAPVAGCDPWQPETITASRVAALEKWSGQSGAELATAPELTKEELASVRQQVDRMLTAEETEATAIGLRLARWGTALAPEITARLKNAAADQDRRRLLTLRYRLVASESLALRWPGGIEQMAETDVRQRRQAAEQLAKLSTADDQPLLMELFADPDALIRELSLRGMQNIGGAKSQTALAKFLADPEPNVRAAVLKLFEENPDPQMTRDVIKYLEQEKDADLVVHGIRLLQSAKGTDATHCLMALLKHKSWQVRSEAAAAIGKLNANQYYGFRMTTDDAETKLKAEAYVALLDLLNDPDDFVVSKAVEGLADANMTIAVEPLANAAVKHPELAVSVLKTLASGSNMHEKALPHIRKFCGHADPRIRAAAICALCESTSENVDRELTAALADNNREVRIAAANAIFHLMDNIRETAVNKSQNSTVTVIHGSSSVTVSRSPSLWSAIGSLFSGSTKTSVAPPVVVEATPIVQGGTDTLAPVPADADWEDTTPTQTKSVPTTPNTPAPHGKPTATAKSPSDAKKPTTANGPTVARSPSVAAPSNGKSTDATKQGASPKIVFTPNTPAVGKLADAKSNDAKLQVGLASPAQPSKKTAQPTVATPTPSASVTKSADPTTPKTEKYPWEKWLKEFYAGEHRPKWTSAMVPPLEKMLQSDSTKERSAAAVALLPLGKVDTALPVLMATLRQDKDTIGNARESLPWLTWETRQKTYRTLQSIMPSSDGLAMLAHPLIETPDPRAADELWAILGDAKASVNEARMVQFGLLQVYTGRSYISSDMSAEAKKEIIATAKTKVASGNDWQRITALALLASADPKEAIPAASQLADNPKLSDVVRNDAFQLQLMLTPKKEARPLAIAALKQTSLERKKAALNYLLGNNTHTLPSGLFVNSITIYRNYGSSQSKPIVPEAPPGITPEDIRPLLKDSDEEVVARAVYLLVLLGEPESVQPLIKRWRRTEGDSEWTRLVYRAIAVTDDPAYIPVLREIYGKLDQSQRGEFYWTIRIMSGPEILKLRKQIRSEAGPNDLQYYLEQDN